MKPDVHRRLTELSQTAGKEYGKLVQKLLAIAFLDAGAESLTERSTQGIDLEVTLHGKPIALEVKTTETGSVSLGRKDLEGLAAREAEGAAAYVAALGGRLLDEWVFARFMKDELQPSRSYSVTQLRPYRDADLERAVADAFSTAVLNHSAAAAAGGQGALDEVLTRHPSYRSA